MASAGSDASQAIGLPSRAAVHRKGMIGQTIRTMAFSIAILGINMATGMVTARLLGPEGRGLQAAYILWPQFLGFATTFGIHAALLYHMKKNPEREASLYFASLLLTLCASVACVAAGMLLIPAWLEEEAVPVARWLMAGTPFMLLFFMHNALFRGREQFHLFNRMRYLVPLLTLASLLLLAMLGRLTPVTSAIAYFAPYVPVTMLAMIRAFRYYWGSVVSGIVTSCRKVLSYGFGAYGIDLLGNVILFIDQIILINLLAPGPLGLYVVAVSLARVTAIFSASINMVLYPKASSLEPREAALLTLRIFRLSSIAALAFSVVYMIAAPYLIHLLYGDRFVESTEVFRLLVLEVILSGAALVLGQAFMAVGKPFIVTISQGIGVILIIPLMYVLVPMYGVMGAGWALLIPAIVRLVFVAAVFEWRFRFNLRALVPSWNDIGWLMSMIRDRKARGATQ